MSSLNDGDDKPTNPHASVADAPLKLKTSSMAMSSTDNEDKESKLPYKKETLIELTENQVKDMTFPPGCRVVSSSGCKGVVVGAYLSLNNGEGIVVYEVETVTESNGNDVDTIMVKEERLSFSPATPVHFKTNPEEVKTAAGSIMSSSRDSNGVLQYSVWIHGTMETIEGVLPEQLSLPVIFRKTLLSKTDKKKKKKVKEATMLSRAVSSESGEDDMRNCSKESIGAKTLSVASKKGRDNSNDDEQVVKKSIKKRKKGSDNEVGGNEKSGHHCDICNVNSTNESDYQDNLIAGEIAEEKKNKPLGEQVDKKSNMKQKKSGKHSAPPANSLVSVAITPTNQRLLRAVSSENGEDVNSWRSKVYVSSEVHHHQ